MSIFNFGQVFSDPVEREWLVYDPLSEAFFGSASQNAGGGFRKNYSPLLTADLIGFENEYRVYADLPGVQPEDVDVSVDDRFLVIQAERKQCHNTETDKIIRLERPYGKVHKKIKLPKSANLEGAKTCLTNGVLCVCIPKIPEEQLAPKKLSITTDST